MKKWFLVVCMLLGLNIFILSCGSPESKEESKGRSSIKMKQWKADSIAARKLMTRLYPDSTMRIDSMTVDSLQTDSLLR